MGNFDRGSKFLLERHGDSLLRLAGVGEIREWRTVQPETIAVGQTPDGLLEARLGGRDDWIRFLIEFATYPNDREYTQLFRGVLLGHAAKGELPEAIVFVLHPKGTKRLPSEMTVQSPLGGTTAMVQWRVVEIWRLPADELLKVEDPGLIPWLPLTDFVGDPGELLDECRQRIERLSPEDEREGMLAATRIFASLRFRDESLLNRLIWRKAMLDIPYLEELKEDLRSQVVAETHRKTILEALRRRFGDPGEVIQSAIRRIDDSDRLFELVTVAWTCGSVEDFATELMGVTQ